MMDESGNACRAGGSPSSDTRARERTAACSRRPQQGSLDVSDLYFGRGQANEDVAASEAGLLGAKELPQHSFHPIAIDRARKDALGNDEAKPGNTERIGPEKQAEPGTPESSPTGEHRGDISGPEALPSTVTPAGAQTLNRLRPLARRARITARPPRVRMRTRNP